jgi:PAS domain S-box-containing protein
VQIEGMGLDPSILRAGAFIVKAMQLFAPTDETASPVKESAEQSSSLFENSTLGVALTNSTFHFRTANPAFSKMLGYSSDELQRLSFLDICIDEDRDECRGPLGELREGERLHYEIETRYRRKDGASLPVNTYLSSVDGHIATSPTFLLVTIDITARRTAEDALRDAQSELTRVARLTTVGAMAASIAHEINQPLASIVANGSAGLRWLERSEPNLEEARSALGRIVNDGHRAAQIIAGIRAMFRKESNARSPVAINELICEVVATSLAELKSRHIALALELFDGLSPVSADLVQLQQVLANLVTNAIDSMASVPDRAHVLTVRSERLNEWILISVQDSGSGIAPEQVERMFDAFYTTKPNGIGLGLSISRSIVEAHGGQLSASPVRPHGSMFCVMLPAER